MSRLGWWMVLLVAGVATAQAAPVDPATATARLRNLTASGASEWRFQHPAQPGGELPGTDDSGWPLVRPEHSWEGASTAAWYRQTITVPETIGGVAVAGSRLTLRCAVDDDLEVYVDGQPRGHFHWDQGLVVITPQAKPGQRFVLAIKALNQGGPGRLLSASLTYDRLEAAREPAEEALRRLVFAQQLLGAKRLAGDRAPYEAALAAAATKISFEALSHDDVAAFARSVTDCSAALQPFSPLARQYALYLVGHAHIDMNWLWLWPETKEVCRLTWTQAIKFMDEFPDFRFTQSQPGAYAAIEQEQPELFRQIQAAVKAGQWEPVGAGWVENDMNMVSGEALARHCLLTDQYYQSRFGVRSATAWCPDTFGHAWTVPSILSDGGLKYYYFCRCGKGLPLFTWEGPDGGRLTAYNFAGWYSEQMRPNKASLPVDLDNRVGVPDAMLVYGVGDHGGGPTRTDVNWAQKLQQDPLFPQVKFATTADYFAAATKAAGKLPVVRDELNTVFEGCYTTHADIKRWNRASENALPTAEALATLAERWGGKYPAAALTQGWRNTLFNQFHDLFDGSAIHDSYAYSGELYAQTEKITEQTIGNSLQALAARVDTSGPGQAVLLWNPVAWERRDFVTVTLPTAAPWHAATALDDRGQIVAAQVLASQGGEVTIGFVATLPALGYAVYHVQPATRAAARAAITPAPGLPAEPQLQMLHEAAMGMSAWNIGRITETRVLEPVAAAHVRQGPVCTRRTTEYRYGASRLKLVETTYRDLPRTDFDLDVDWQEVGNAREGGAFLKAAFVTPAREPRATFSIPWGSLERPTGGREVPAQQWVDLADTVPAPGSDNHPPRALDLSRYFNLDAVATLAQPVDGDFDDGDRAYPDTVFGATGGAELVVDGVPFRRPPLGAGENNAVVAQGQTLEWPAVRTPALAVLGASSNGRHSGPARLLYADGTEQSVVLEFSDWCFGPGPGESTALRADHRLGAAGKIEPPVYLWLRRLETDPTKALRGIVLPEEPDLKLFGLACAGKSVRVDRQGLALLNDCKYGFDVQGGTLRMSLLRASYDPDPRPDQGRHQIRYALLPHVGDWRQAGVPRRGHEFNNPVLALPVGDHSGALPKRGEFLRVEPANLVVTALKPAEDGRGVIVRVYNSTGVGGPVTLTCGWPVQRATECNLLEEPRAENTARVRGATITFDLQGRLHGTVRLE